MGIHFDGPECKYGHNGGRYTNGNRCVTCARERTKKWQEDNRDRYLKDKRERGRAYYAKNPDAFKDAVRRYHKKNPHEGARYAQTRRARLARAEGQYSSSDIEEILEYQGNSCANPNCSISFKEVSHQVDHIIPLSKGGSNWPDNLQCLCSSCNCRKSSKMPIEWIISEADRDR